MEQINKASEMSVDRPMDSGFDKSTEIKSDVTVSSDAICQSDYTEGAEVEDSFFSRRRRNTIHASLIDIKAR